MTIEQRVAVLEEIFFKLQDYYMSDYSGEEIDALLASAGVPIGITKEYDSVSAMNDDFSSTDVTRGQFVLILPSDTSSKDYGKVYIKSTSNWVYVFTLTALTAIKGPQGPAGKRGAKGADGADGKNFMVLGYYETLSALNAAVPSPEAGDTYGIGTEPPYAYYMYDPTISTWRYVGNLQGPAGLQGEKGDKGDKGDTGATGPQGPEGPVGGASNFVRYDAAQTLTDEQRAQARGNIEAQSGSLVQTTFDTKGWYRIATGSRRSGGILTVQHSYNNGGTSSLKLLVTSSEEGSSLKCIEYTNYSASAITNARIVSNASGLYCIDVYYNVDGLNTAAIDFISTGLDEAKGQVPVYIGADDTLPSGENLKATMEYLNPPLVLGVEYRTTERFLGKPVYVKAINFGAIAVGLNAVSFMPDADRPIRCYAMLTNTNATIPWIGTPGTDQSFCSINGGNARIHSTAAFSAGAVVFVGYYYKTNE